MNEEACHLYPDVCLVHGEPSPEDPTVADRPRTRQATPRLAPGPARYTMPRSRTLPTISEIYTPPYERHGPFRPKMDEGHIVMLNATSPNVYSLEYKTEIYEQLAVAAENGDIAERVRLLQKFSAPGKIAAWRVGDVD